MVGLSNGYAEGLFKLFLFIQLLTRVTTESSCSNAVCSKISEDFCYYFGKSSCYQLMCVCSEDCKTTTPFWCSNEIDGEEQTIDELEKQVPTVSMHCNDLLRNCKQRNPQRSGHCFFYDKTCLNETWTGNSTLKDMDNLYPDLVPSVMKKRGKNKKRWQFCAKLKKRCKQHDQNHFSCRRFETRCRKIQKFQKPKSGAGAMSVVNVLLIFISLLIP